MWCGIRVVPDLLAKPGSVASHPAVASSDTPTGPDQWRNPTMTEGAQSPSDEIDATIADLGDWRGDLLARARDLIRARVA